MKEYVKEFPKEPSFRREGFDGYIGEIDNDIYEVKKGNIIEIPPSTKFIFAGEMELLLIMNPKFTREGEIVGEDNDLY